MQLTPEQEAAKKAEADAATAQVKEDQAAAEAAKAKELETINARLADLQKNLAGSTDKEDLEKKRTDFQEKYNLDDKQMEGVGAIVQDAVSTTLARVNRDSGESKAKEVLGKAAPALISEVQRIMATYSPAHQGDPKVWGEVAVYVRGNNIETYTKANAAGGGVETPLSNGPKIRGTNMGGFSRPNGGSGGNDGGGAGNYAPEEQAVIDRNHGGDAKEYEKFRNSNEVVAPGYYDPNRGKPKF